MRVTGSQEPREVPEPLRSDPVGSDHQAEGSGLDSDGFGSRQCGVVGDEFWKVLLAADGGPQGCWREEACMSRHWTWRKDLRNTSLVESRHEHSSVTSRAVISAATEEGRRWGGVLPEQQEHR